jgi:hypothetical protein
MANPTQMTDAQMATQVERAQRQFNRVLLTWASDVLELRRRHLLVPAWNHAIPAHQSAPSVASQGDPLFLPMNDAA